MAVGSDLAQHDAPQEYWQYFTATIQVAAHRALRVVSGHPWPPARGCVGRARPEMTGSPAPQQKSL